MNNILKTIWNNKRFWKWYRRIVMTVFITTWLIILLFSILDSLIK